jgi:hypothetical protein
MPESKARYYARRVANFLIGLLPPKQLAFFLRSFETIQDKAEAAGYNVFPRRYDSPFPSEKEIDWNQLQVRRALPAINFDLDQADRLLRLLARYCEELSSIPYARTPASLFWFDNETFTDFDAAVLHGMLRHLKPKRYIELGCGLSSFISSRALKRNAEEGHVCEAIYADPAPQRDVSQLVAYGQMVYRPVQQLPTAMFADLKAGDVLFIDTSHVVKLQSDVVDELVRILPSLNPGTWIHFHDIFTPYDYPEDWLKRPLRLSCNEQYALECLLSGGDRYKVQLPLYMLWKERRDALQRLLSVGKTRPHGFWITKELK